LRVHCFFFILLFFFSLVGRLLCDTGMGAVPSRESTSLFSYFRGSYEVGMVPLTKYYFGRDTAAASAAAATPAHEPEIGSVAVGASPSASATARDQLRQQLLLMRRDPAVLYANAREVDNILDSLLHDGTDKDGSSCEVKSKSSIVPSPAAASTTTSKSGLAEHGSPKLSSSPATASTPAKPPTAERSEDGLKVLGNDIKKASREELLRREYWNVMPNNNFTEDDLDHFLELVEETLFRTNEELLAADPIREASSEVSDADPPTQHPFLPVPCALCLAYPDGKERDCAFSLDGRVVNIIGYFGLMTAEMQEAFKVTKRIPSDAEVQQQQQKQREGEDQTKAATHGDSSRSAQGDGDAMPTMWLNTAILTSAGDRTLERVLVLAAVMLRQQFHTIGRRHLLQAKLDQLLRQQQDRPSDTDVDTVQMICYLQSVLAIPLLSNTVLGAQAASADGVQLPFFDPLLEVPLPSIPRGIYKPTHYINAASTELLPRRLSSMNSLGHAPYNGSAAESNVVASTSAPYPRSLPPDASAAASFSSGHRALLCPQGGSVMSAGMQLTPGAILVPGSPPESTVSPPLLMTDSMAGSQTGAPASSFHNTGTQQQQQQRLPLPPMSGPAALPLDQCDEDAITMAFCRRMEKIVVHIESASNNYSALKSLTENFAFLHCQIELDEKLTTMELIDLPGLAETPSFKPLLSAMTPVTTLKAAAAPGSDKTKKEEDGSADRVPLSTATDATATSTEECSNDAASHRKNLARYTLSPNSAVVITLNPLLVRQATMWASSFFHCPTRLPTGSWVKYKLKDECDQLRHVLQNKDMLIAHWRKTNADRASRYLGTHTGRLLEHVQALQAETEEARALPIDCWSHCPLFVNQDGRRYALFQSRYGTMLIGVRALSANSNSSSALTSGERVTGFVSGGGGKAWQGSASAPSRHNSIGSESGHNSSLSQRPCSTNPSRNPSRADRAFYNHGSQRSNVITNSSNSNNSGGGGGYFFGGACEQGGQPPHPFVVASSSPFPPYAAPPVPHDALPGGMNPFYGPVPLMVPQGGGGDSSAVDVPRYYAQSPMAALGGSSGAVSYGSKPPSMPALHLPTSTSWSGALPPGMVHRAPPPPPPHRSTMSANASSTSSSTPALMTANVPQYFDPSRAILSASVNGSNNDFNHYGRIIPGAAAAAGGGAEAGGPNVLHLIPHSRVFGTNHTPSFSSPQQQTGAPPAMDSASTPLKPPKSGGVPLWQSTTASSLPIKPAQPPLQQQQLEDSNVNKPTSAASALPSPHRQTRSVNRNGAPLHVTGVAKAQAASLLCPVPSTTNPTSTTTACTTAAPAATTTAAGSASLLRSNEGSATLWIATAPTSEPRPHSLSPDGLHNAPRPSTILLFAADSIWGPDASQDAADDAARQPSYPHTSAQSLVEHKPTISAAQDGASLSPRKGQEVAGLEEAEGRGSEATAQGQKASSIPWAWHLASDWTTADDPAGVTPNYLLRGAEMLDADDDDERKSAADAGQQLCSEPPTNDRKEARSVRSTSARTNTNFSSRQANEPPTSAAFTGEMDAANSDAGASPWQSQRGSEQAGAFGAATPPARYVPMDPHTPTAHQGVAVSTYGAYPLCIYDASHPSTQQTMATMPPHNTQQLQPLLSVPTHTGLPLSPNRLLYYTVANGVPMLVQPPTTPGGVAMSFSLSGPVTHSDDLTLQSYEASLSSLPHQQQQQQQQQQPLGLLFMGELTGTAAGSQSTSYLSAHASPPRARALYNPTPHANSLTPHAGGAR
jgi:hypothetical protein